MPVVSVDGVPVGGGAPGLAAIALQQALRSVARGTLIAMSEEKIRLGGMALANGVLVQGPTAWACAIRHDDGRIEVASARKRFRAAGVKTPLLRGPARLLEALAVLPDVKRKLPAARLPMQDGRALASVVGAATLVRGVRESSRLRPAAQELLAGIASLAPALLALRGGELAAYHGAEHISIGTYEHGARRDEGARALRRPSHRPARRHLRDRQHARRARAGAAARPRARGGAVRRDRGVDRALRLDGPPPEERRRPGALEARPRAPAPALDRRADAGAARGGRGGARTPAWSSRMATTRSTRSRLDPEIFDLPVDEDARRLLHGRLLQPFARDAARRRTPPARRHAGVPEEPRVPRRHGRGDRDPQALQRGLGCADGARALRRRRDRSVRDGHDDRGRLHALRASRDRVPRRARAAHAHHDERRRRHRGGEPQADHLHAGAPRPSPRADGRRLRRVRRRARHRRGDRRDDRRAGVVVGRARHRHRAARAHRRRTAATPSSPR